MTTIQQGTTPTHTFMLPFDVDLLTRVRVTYKQGGEVILEKETEDCTLEGNTIKLTLSQEETLLFSKTGILKVKVQLHCVTTAGQAMASQIFEASVPELLSGKVL